MNIILIISDTLRPQYLGCYGNEWIRTPHIDRLAERYLARMPYKAQGCRSHSFVTYFSTPQKLGWVEFTGSEEPSAFQEHHPEGHPRKYFRLTQAGLNASDDDWANPHRALYGRGE
jgi:hypothetical protein